MAVDLMQFVGKTVFSTHSNGVTEKGVLSYKGPDFGYPFVLGGRSYRADGTYLYYGCGGLDNEQNIVHIEELKPAETSQPETKITIKKLKQQQEQLKQQLAEVEESIKVAEAQFVPNNFVLQEVLDFLDNNTCNVKWVENLNLAFDWESTPQGKCYWEEIYTGRTGLEKDDIIQIQKWVINFMRLNQIDTKGDSC
jgi:hypothetical protein